MIGQRHGSFCSLGKSAVGTGVSSLFQTRACSRLRAHVRMRMQTRCTHDAWCTLVTACCEILCMMFFPYADPAGRSTWFSEFQGADSVQETHEMRSRNLSPAPKCFSYKNGWTPLCIPLVVHVFFGSAYLERLFVLWVNHESHRTCVRRIVPVRKRTIGTIASSCSFSLNQSSLFFILWEWLVCR